MLPRELRVCKRQCGDRATSPLLRIVVIDVPVVGGAGRSTRISTMTADARPERRNDSSGVSEEELGSPVVQVYRLSERLVRD
jgi:hypothetical protein